MRNSLAQVRPNPEPPPLPSGIADDSTPRITVLPNVSTPKTGQSTLPSRAVTQVNQPVTPAKADRAESSVIASSMTPPPLPPPPPLVKTDKAESIVTTSGTLPPPPPLVKADKAESGVIASGTLPPPPPLVKTDKAESSVSPSAMTSPLPLHDSATGGAPALSPVPASSKPLTINQVAPAPPSPVTSTVSESAKAATSGPIEVKHSVALKEVDSPAPPRLPGSYTALNDIKAIRASGPAVRMVNSKRITLNYELKGVGPSGVSAVELWYTMDAKTWKKSNTPPQTKPPYVIEVSEEGVYGFTLLAKSGIGIGKEPPKPGEQPQVWVEVDMTRPVVRLLGIEANLQNNAPNLVVRWSASDKNLGSRPITLSYAEHEQGPWVPMASNIENTGRFVWPLPSNAPARFLVRVEAIDLPGNVGSAQTPRTILVDTAVPTVAILNVEPAKK
jgi:hypothetical protein